MSKVLHMVGRVASLWRYPVKSMAGEQVDEIFVSNEGVVGDRMYALVDAQTGKAISARKGKKWQKLLHFSATLTTPAFDQQLLRMRIVFPDGKTEATFDDPSIHEMLSDYFDHAVRLEIVPGTRGSFCDRAPVHLITLQTVRSIIRNRRRADAQTPRFRANIVARTGWNVAGFPEDGWISTMLEVGEADLCVEKKTSRCALITMAQPHASLSKDSGILRSVAQLNNNNAGVYLSVMREGIIRSGDPIVSAR